MPHKYADSQLLAGLRAAAEATGQPLTVKQYDAWRAAQADEHASGIWIIRHFGTWRAALERAGLEANTTRSTSSKWTDEEMLDQVAAYLAAGSTGSYAGYEAWAKETAAAPSAASVRARFGTWAEARRRAEG